MKKSFLEAAEKSNKSSNSYVVTENNIAMHEMFYIFVISVKHQFRDIFFLANDC